MPLTANPPTLSGDLLTISRFLSSPGALQRRLRDFRDLRFVADQMLTQRFSSQGGAVLYEHERAVGHRPHGRGRERPGRSTRTRTCRPAPPRWPRSPSGARRSSLTDEEIARNVYGGGRRPGLRKVINSIIKQVDGITMSAIYSAVTADLRVTSGDWWRGRTPVFLRDILKAKAAIVGLNLGYNPDTLALNDNQYAYLMSDDKFTNALKREDHHQPGLHRPGRAGRGPEHHRVAGHRCRGCDGARLDPARRHG
jgi:hypothetical protein